jgi:hypothetical protein
MPVTLHSTYIACAGEFLEGKRIGKLCSDMSPEDIVTGRNLDDTVEPSQSILFRVDRQLVRLSQL